MKRCLLPVKCIIMASFLLLTIFSTGCATAGRDFNELLVSKIEIGKTSKNDIKLFFGSPWRVGVEDGKPTWTYGNYSYKVFGEPSTKDLVIRFNNSGIVTSYVYNTTEHRE